MTADAGRRKNILVIHLESISNTILWQYRAELGTVWRLLQKSLWFPKFQTTSTSTEMTMADFLYADASVHDHKAHFRGQLHAYSYPLGSLTHHGYRSLILTRNFMFAQPTESGEGILYDTPDLNDFYRKQSEFMQTARDEGKPFFLYVNNAISHMAFDAETKAQSRTFSERFKNGYIDFDTSVNFTLTKLLELGLWEDTIILCFGDHGDELWSHGVSRGYCHIITPYTPLCRTPMFLFDGGKTEGICYNYVNTTDLLPGLIEMVTTEKSPLRAGLTSPLAGEPYRHSLGTFRNDSGGISFSNQSQSRVFLFSQNLFALQLEYDDPEKGLTKGYAVWDGYYRLTVSSGGSNPLNGGMELFNDALDPANMLNLLNFFELNRNGDIVATRKPPTLIHPDFAALFQPENIESVKYHFRVLKGELQAYVRAKELRAAAFNDGTRHVMPESAFKRIRENIRPD